MKHKYYSFEEMVACGKLEDLSHLGFQNYFINCKGDVFSFRYIKSELTLSQLNELRQKFSTRKYTQAQLANEYSVSRQWITRILKDKHCQDYRKLKLKISTTGYYLVTLYKHGQPYTKKIHHLVLETFVGPKKFNEQTRHLDGNKLNNELVNLCWGTQSQNEQDKIRHNRSNHGERSVSSKLTESQVIQIRKLYLLNKRIVELAKMFNVTSSNIDAIINYKSWRHLIVE